MMNRLPAEWSAQEPTHQYSISALHKSVCDAQKQLTFEYAYQERDGLVSLEQNATVTDLYTRAEHIKEVIFLLNKETADVLGIDTAAGEDGASPKSHMALVNDRGKYVKEEFVAPLLWDIAQCIEEWWKLNPVFQYGDGSSLEKMHNTYNVLYEEHYDALGDDEDGTGPTPDYTGQD